MGKQRFRQDGRAKQDGYFVYRGESPFDIFLVAEKRFGRNLKTHSKMWAPAAENI
jgi:hypothetical protein